MLRSTLPRGLPYLTVVATIPTFPDGDGRGLLLPALPRLPISCATRISRMAPTLDAGIRAEHEAPFDKAKRAACDSPAELSFAVEDEK
jgi:hypothetical protein